MPNLRPAELLLILLIVVLLFGAKKLPEAARGLGRSLRIFKAETKALRDEDEPAQPPVTRVLPPEPAPPAPPPVDPATRRPSAADS